MVDGMSPHARFAQASSGVRSRGGPYPSWFPRFAILILALLFAGKVSRKMPDLEVYWTAAVRARSAEPLYRVEDEHYQFKYLPGIRGARDPRRRRAAAGCKGGLVFRVDCAALDAGG